MNYVNTFHFAVITETFLDCSFDYDCVFPDYLKFYAPSSKLSTHGRNSGGVLLLIKKCFKKYIKEIKTNGDNLVIVKINKEVFGVNKDVILVAIYVPPEGSPFYAEKMVKDGILSMEETLFQHFERELSDLSFIVIGDLNARTESKQYEDELMMNYATDENLDLDNDYSARSSNDTMINNFGKSLLEFCFMFELFILNGIGNGVCDGGYTFVSPNGSSVIDYILLQSDLLSNFDLRIGDQLFSWHLPVEASWKKCDVSTEGRRSYCKGEQKIVWSEENVNVYKCELQSEDFLVSIRKARELLHLDLDNSLDIFLNAMYGAAACMVRVVGRGIKKCNDYFDHECEQKKREVKRLLKRVQRCKIKEDKLEKRKEYTKSRKEYNELRKLKKQQFEEDRLNKLRNSACDSKTFWALIKSVNRKTFVYNNITIEQWHDHFFHVFNDSISDDVEENNNLPEEEEHHEPLFNDPISVEEVIAGIKHLKLGKSAGSDKIIAEMLRDASFEIVNFLADLFNTLFESGNFPLDWAKSIIIPIHKKR